MTTPTSARLGHRYRDLATGKTGIAMSRHLYAFGCERVTLQYVDADDNIRDETFDIGSLEHVEPGPAELLVRIEQGRHPNPRATNEYAAG